MRKACSRLFATGKYIIHRIVVMDSLWWQSIVVLMACGIAVIRVLVACGGSTLVLLCLTACGCAKELPPGVHSVHVHREQAIKVTIALDKLQPK